LIKKYLNKILIVVVLAIWGIVIYSYSQKYFKKTPNKTINRVIDKKKELIAFKHKEFNIFLLERDPFLDKKNIISTKHRVKTVKKFESPKIFNIKWPAIEYFGFVKNDNNNSTKRVILKVDGKVINIKEKSFYEKYFYIQKAYNDSIILRKSKEKRTFKKL